MRVFVERSGKKYEIVKCGKKCSFARKDAVYHPYCECTKKWEVEHCALRCHLPQWWLNARQFVESGLREMKEKKGKTK